MMSRANCYTTKVATEFGTMYVHLEVDSTGLPVGGSISNPGKNPGSQIDMLISALSIGLEQCAQEVHRRAISTTQLEMSV